MTSAKKFWDKAAQKYAASPIKDMAAYEHTLDRVRAYLTPEAKVLEVGCGTGSTALLLAPDVAQYTGTDISPEMLQFAKGKSKGIENLSFEVMTADETTQVAGEYDVVLGFNIFHLTERSGDLFAKLHEQLPVGGMFISKTACLAEPSIGAKRFAFAALIPVMRLFRMAPYVTSFSFSQLEGMIEQAGFEIVETGSFPAMSRFIVARRAG